jgi:peptide/nickel transport system substrate-binding protein
MDRRRFLQGTAAGGALALVGCAPQGAKMAAVAQNANALRLGLGGGSTTDSLDPRTYTDSFSLVVGYQIMNGLIELDEKGQATPELLESWEAKPGAADWVFNVRKGITFHNGKTLDADDVIYSLNLHRQADKSPGHAGLASLAGLRKLDANQISITLNEGNADLLYVLADYHYLVVPDGFSDWSHPIGTGAFRFDSFQPGVSASTLRNPNYWKPGRGRVEAVVSTVINDSRARMEALESGQVDITHRVDPASADRFKAAGFEVVRGEGGYHAMFGMQTDATPFDKVEVRRALKAGIDREAMLKELFSGYGRVGNDQPIPSSNPLFNTELAQTVYDPDKAKFHLKQAGLDALSVTLHSSEACFMGAVDFAEAYKAQAARAGLDLKVVNADPNTFWDKTWMVEPFVVNYWGGRPAATQMFDVAYASNAPWNETHWHNAQFDELLKTAKTELDLAKRKQAIWEMQAMLHDDGGAIIPAFKDWVDAHAKRVKGHTPHSVLDLDNGRIAEKVWLEG